MKRAFYVMTDAIETSALVYWAEARNVCRNGDGYVTSFQVRDAGNEAERHSDVWVTVNSKIIEAHAKRLLNGTIAVRRDIAAQFIGREWETDSEGIDAIIQSICFSGIIFG